jgi:hypothetical protein
MQEKHSKYDLREHVCILSPVTVKITSIEVPARSFFSLKTVPPQQD